MPIVLAIVGLFVGAFVLNAGDAAGHALWLPVVLGGLAFATLALWWWHRRALAHLNQLHLVVIGRYANVHAYRPWPKYCLDCGQEMSSSRQCVAHDDPESSPCMKLRVANEAVDAAAEPSTARYTAEVLDTPAEDGGHAIGGTSEARKARSKAIVEATRARRG